MLKTLKRFCMTAIARVYLYFNSRGIFCRRFYRGLFMSKVGTLVQRVGLHCVIKTATHFDMRDIDQEIERLSPNIVFKNEGLANKNKIGYVATELYDMGGHTKCLQNLIAAMADTYEQHMYLGHLNASYKLAPVCMKSMAEDCAVAGVNMSKILYEKQVINLFCKIAHERPAVLFSFIHPDDLAGALVLALIKKYTSIKILYCPHASHFPNVGMRFADLVLEASPLLACITKKLRKIDRVSVVGMLSKQVDRLDENSPEILARKRAEIGIKKSNLCTMSGGAAYKFFDSASSEYFEMIKSLLARNHSLQHVIISEFSPEQLRNIENIIDTVDIASRLIILPFTTEYELVFQCADVFIDSFPVGAALTQIDLMRLKVPSVVKINRQNSIWTFHQYQMENYPYMFETVEAMKEGIETLLSDKKEARRIALENFEFYMRAYERNVVKERLCDIINNADKIEVFMTSIDDDQCATYALPECRIKQQ